MRIETTRSWIGIALAVLLTLGAGAALVGCGSEDEACRRVELGEFVLTVDPPPPSEGDSLSNAGYLGKVITLVSVAEFPGSTPPEIQYRFLDANDRRLDLQIPDFGAKIPIDVDSTYTMDLEITQRAVPQANGIKIYDERGLRFLAVLDWRPQHQIFEDGFGDLGEDGRLQVFFSDPGCDPREEDSACFREIRNFQLEFVLGGTQRVKLWNQERGEIGEWTFLVHKATRVLANEGCGEGLLLQNGVSFSVIRTSAL